MVVLLGFIRDTTLGQFGWEVIRTVLYGLLNDSGRDWNRNIISRSNLKAPMFSYTNPQTDDPVLESRA